MSTLTDQIYQSWKNRINFLNIKEMVQLARIQQNPYFIQYIKNPSEAMQLTAVQKNGATLEYIQSPSEAIQLAAVSQNPDAILHIENPSEQVQLAAVNQNGNYIQTIANPSEAVQFAAVNQSWEFIQGIDNPSEPVQLAAVNQNEGAIQFIKNPTEKVQIVAIEKDLGCIALLDSPCEAVQIYAAKLDPISVSLIPSTEKARMIAVELDPKIIRHIENPSPALCKVAIEKEFPGIKINDANPVAIKELFTTLNGIETVDMRNNIFEIFKDELSLKTLTTGNSQTHAIEGYSKIKTENDLGIQFNKPYNQAGDVIGRINYYGFSGEDDVTMEFTGKMEYLKAIKKELKHNKDGFQAITISKELELKKSINNLYNNAYPAAVIEEKEFPKVRTNDTNSATTEELFKTLESSGQDITVALSEYRESTEKLIDSLKIKIPTSTLQQITQIDTMITTLSNPKTAFAIGEKAEQYVPIFKDLGVEKQFTVFREKWEELNKLCELSSDAHTKNLSSKEKRLIFKEYVKADNAFESATMGLIGEIKTKELTHFEEFAALSVPYKNLGYDTVAETIEKYRPNYTQVASSGSSFSYKIENVKIQAVGTKTLYGDINISKTTGKPTATLDNFRIKDKVTGKIEPLKTNGFDICNQPAENLKKMLSGGKTEIKSAGTGISQLIGLNKTPLGWGFTIGKQVFSTADAQASI